MRRTIIAVLVLTLGGCAREGLTESRFDGGISQDADIIVGDIKDGQPVSDLSLDAGDAGDGASCGRVGLPCCSFDSDGCPGALCCASTLLCGIECH
jgi:hypothetical protein